MSRRTSRFAALTAAAALALAACGGGSSSTSTDTATGAASSDGTYNIGITQIVSHPSLDAIAQGFQDALADAGVDVTYDLQNAQGDQSIAASIAGQFAEGNYDMIVAIATPTAQAVAQSVTDTPILFAGVTDHVSAGLVDSWEQPGANITGTSDAPPLTQQLELLQQLVPDAETIGVVYSSAEENSAVVIQQIRDAASELGLEVREATVSTSSEVQQAAQSLDVDAYFVTNDNTVVSAVESLIQVAEDAGVPVITSDADSVDRGATATYAFDYYEMGYQTGEMAIPILQDGVSPADVPVETSDNLILKVNTAAADRIGLTIPQELLDDPTTEIVEH